MLLGQDAGCLVAYGARELLENDDGGQVAFGHSIIGAERHSGHAKFSSMTMEAKWQCGHAICLGLGELALICRYLDLTRFLIFGAQLALVQYRVTKQLVPNLLLKQKKLAF